MSSEKLQAQEFAVRVLKSHIATKRLAHTYLLTGNKDSGKDEVALAFAAALNCSESHSFESCGCIPCKKVAEANHPDVKCLGEDAKARSIKIEEIRTMIGETWLKPYEGKWKVFILKNAKMQMRTTFTRRANIASIADFSNLLTGDDRNCFCRIIGN